MWQLNSITETCLTRPIAVSLDPPFPTDSFPKEVLTRMQCEFGNLPSGGIGLAALHGGA